MSEFEKLKAGLIKLNGDSQAGYYVSAELAEAANVALWLARPLLVTGEPGTGKTQLASAIAKALGRELLSFNCKSTSLGRDVLYQFDHLGRLYDAQHKEAEKQPKEKYVTYQALGRAIVADSPKVVLIDEIDKAPRDFPNDLLHEIDQRSFGVNEAPELGTFQAKVPLAVVITSNSERQLPLPFLRRCTYFHIQYPSEDALRDIVLLHTRELGAEQGLVKAAVQRFEELRKLPGLVKRPATDELIAWTKILIALKASDARVAGDPLSKLPGLSAVLKSVEDTKRLPR